MGYHSLCYVSLDSKLADFERKCGIVRRWNRTDREYIEAKKAFLTEKQEQLHSCLWAAVVKRQYLLQMKAKYAGIFCCCCILFNLIAITLIDGQKIAKKLSIGISKEMKRVKQLLEEYNGTCYELDSQCLPRSISDVLSPTSDFWGADKAESSSIPYKMKKDIIQALLLTRRSKEELELLRNEMCDTVSYWSLRTECIANKITEFDQDDIFSRGARCLLTKLKTEADLMLLNATTAFEVPMHNITETSHSHDDVESSDSDTSYDTDSDGC